MTSQSEAVFITTVWPKYFSQSDLESPPRENSKIRKGKEIKVLWPKGLLFHSDLSRRDQLEPIPSSRILVQVTYDPSAFTSLLVLSVQLSTSASLNRR